MTEQAEKSDKLPVLVWDESEWGKAEWAPRDEKEHQRKAAVSAATRKGEEN